MSNTPIIVTVSGGVVQHVGPVPPGVTVEIRDYDCMDGNEFDPATMHRDAATGEYYESWVAGDVEAAPEGRRCGMNRPNVSADCLEMLCRARDELADLNQSENDGDELLNAIDLAIGGAQAAPDLLAVCRNALADLEGIMPEFEPSGDRQHPGWKTIEELRHAIRHARPATSGRQLIDALREAHDFLNSLLSAKADEAIDFLVNNGEDVSDRISAALAANEKDGAA